MPILKQINRQNEDGSYSFGYEAADRSFKIETKYPNGEVYGKYGYVDDTGKVREVEYGASRRGFEPQGTLTQINASFILSFSSFIHFTFSPNFLCGWDILLILTNNLIFLLQFPSNIRHVPIILTFIYTLKKSLFQTNIQYII